METFTHVMYRGRGVISRNCPALHYTHTCSTLPFFFSPQLPPLDVSALGLKTLDPATIPPTNPILTSTLNGEATD